MPDYRERLYARYASAVQGSGERFDVAGAERWGRAYRYYYRGWWPADRSAPVVDVACGRGWLLHLLRQLGYGDVHGVDLSPEQVALSRQVVPGVELADAVAYLDRNRGRFALVTAIDVIEHLRKDEVLDFLDAAYAALAPGGRLVLQTPNADAPFGMQLRYGDFTHELAFGPGVLDRLLRMTGFTATEARELGPVPRGYSLSSTARYALWQLLRLGCDAWNVIETGSPGSRIYTRVFAISAVRAG